MSHCLIFDIGKTNKKAIVFDENYRILCEKTTQFPETTDEDGDPCEDIGLLEQWVLETAAEIHSDSRFHIKAVNCATYGASLVYLDEDLRPLAPLYNYLKPFPQDLLAHFLDQYGGAEKICLETASPLLGNLNSGLQLYRLKQHKPVLFDRIRYALHLPQWIALLLSGADQGAFQLDRTSIGCHTMLWDFQKNDYHDWVIAEGLAQKLAPFPAKNQPHTATCTGLHDSSAALIPYLMCIQTPFVLISTGTWCISLNPFNNEALTKTELAQDCLCYMTREGKPVKAARYFGGQEHDEAVKAIAGDYGLAPDFYINGSIHKGGHYMDYQNALHAYGLFMQELVQKQVFSTRLAIGNSPVRHIFVAGGFAQNALYMRLLAEAFPDMEVQAAEIAQATALGSALACHAQWNARPLPANLLLS